MEATPRRGLDRFWAGFGLSLALTLASLGALVVYYHSAAHGSWQAVWFAFRAGRVLTSIISLCALPNLALFYLFMRRDLYRAARGVIFTTLLAGVAMLVLKASSLG